jgi:hypothetical protein
MLGYLFRVASDDANEYQAWALRVLQMVGYVEMKAAERAERRSVGKG